MLIDWFTVSAQAVNFLILVWLLKRFLYKPILNAIDEREKLIAAQLQDADAKKSQAQQERDEFERKNEEFARQRDTMMSQATAEAKGARQRLMDEARQQAQALRAKLQDALGSEQEALKREIASRTQHEVFAIARKALSDLAATNLEERITEVFIRRLCELTDEEKGKLASARKNPHRSALVRSAFELAPAQREAIERAVKETLAGETQVQFETLPSLVSGIELTTNGHKVAWSIADYLASMEKSVGEVMEANHATDQ